MTVQCNCSSQSNTPRPTGVEDKDVNFDKTTGPWTGRNIRLRAMPLSCYLRGRWLRFGKCVFLRRQTSPNEKGLANSSVVKNSVGYCLYCTHEHDGLIRDCSFSSIPAVITTALVVALVSVTFPRYRMPRAYHLHQSRSSSREPREYPR